MHPCADPLCAALVRDGTPRCPDHTPRRGTTPTKRIHNTKRWKTLRLRYLAEHPTCECPLCIATDTPLMADEVDHIKPIEDGGPPYSESNLQSMAHAHHSAKTRRDVQRRVY